MTRTKHHLIADLKTMIDEGQEILDKASGEGRKLTTLEREQVDAILAETKTHQAKIVELERAEVDRKVSKIAHAGLGRTDLLAEFKSAGWEPGKRTYIDNPGFEFKAASFDGDVADLSPIRREGAELGFDSRYIYTAFPTEAVSGEVTSVQVLLQSSRTLPDPSDVVRAIDAVTPKPEVSSVKTLQTVDLQQVAATEVDTPNVILAQPSFRSMVERDLLTTIREGYDQLVLDAVAAVTPQTTAPGADMIASLRLAIEDLAAAGYDGPYTALLSPTDAVDLDLFQTSGPEAMYVFGPGQFARAPFGLRVRIGKNVTDPMVTDAAAFGRLYATGLALSTHEQDAGQTNTSTVRLEGHAAFGVEREDALTVIAESS